MVLVWTATCREMHDGKLRGIVFTNEHGQKRNITIEDMENFFQTHYVSNLIYDKGRIQGIGISLNQLDTYNLTRSGSYRVTPGIGETNIYGLAAPYINNQRVKIKQDKANGRLKTEEVVSASDDNNGGLTGTQKLAVATAVAGATVVGVNKLAKVVSNQINSKKYAEIKQEIFDKLTKYQSMIEELIRVKNETNKQIQNNPSIVKYSSSMDSRNALTQNVKNNIDQYGIVGCVNNLATLITQCSQSVQAYNLMDSTLDDIGITGTLRVQLNFVESRLNNLKQLHLKTKQLIENNMQMNNGLRQQEMYRAQMANEQQEIVNSIERNISDIENTLIRLRAQNNPVDAIASLISINTQSIRNTISTLADDCKRDEYYDYLYNLEQQITEQRLHFETEKRMAEAEKTTEANNLLHSIEITIDELKNGKYSGDEAYSKLEDTKNKMFTLESKLHLLEDSVREPIESRIKDIRKNWTYIETKITKGIELANQLGDDTKAFETYRNSALEIIAKIERVHLQIELDEQVKEYRSLNTQNYTMLARLKRTAGTNIKEDIDNIEKKFNEAKHKANSSIEAVNEYNAGIVNDAVEQIEGEINRIHNIVVTDDVTQFDIDNLTFDIDRAELVDKEFGFTTAQVQKIANLVSKLNREVKYKKDSMETRIKSVQKEYERLQAKRNKVNHDLASEIEGLAFEVSTYVQIGSAKVSNPTMRKLTTIFSRYDTSLIDNLDSVKERVKSLIDELNTKMNVE